MPVMDGFEAAAELEQFAHPPGVLMLTGSNEPEDVDRARRVGAKGYITKDSIAARLVDAILAAAGARQREALLPFCARCCRSPPSSRSSSRSRCWR